MESELKTRAKIWSQEDLIRSIPQPGLQELSLETIPEPLKRKAVTNIAIREPAVAHPFCVNFSRVLAFGPITAAFLIHFSVERFKKLELLTLRFGGFLSSGATAGGIFPGTASDQAAISPGFRLFPQ